MEDSNSKLSSIIKSNRTPKTCFKKSTTDYSLKVLTKKKPIEKQIKIEDNIFHNVNQISKTDLCYTSFSYDRWEDQSVIKRSLLEDENIASFEERTNEEDVSGVSTNKGTRKPKTAPASFMSKENSFTSLFSNTNCKKEIKSFRIYHRDNLVLSKFLQTVLQAVKMQKLFVIGNKNKTAFPTIRNSLTSRGWVEKWTIEPLVEGRVVTPRRFESIMTSFNDAPANFIWVHDSVINYGKVPDSTIVSRYPKQTHFTTKVGLCQLLENFHWFHNPGVSKTVFPKTFRIESECDVELFRFHFGLSACISLLKIVVDKVTTAESDYFFRNGKVPISTVDFANALCSEYILCRQHDDIDRQEQPETTAKEWEEFLACFYMIAHEGEHFQTTPYPMIQGVYSMSKTTLKNIAAFWPQLEVEGCKNLWIVKPPAAFCGRNVKVMRDLDQITSHMESGAHHHKIGLHIVQKYIERPLLIYDTKFDIRQWFLITSIYPLTIWIYKDCYLRFSSQLFSLENLDRSIHLTNNAVQCHYTNSTARHPKLPLENMWHCVAFQEYLRTIDEPDKWEEVIGPGIKQGIVGAVLAAQDEMIDRPNTFELYGADFLLGADYVPMLLEINEGPAMGPSTSVTADLSKSALEDIIKVVIDRRDNPNADTGRFELLYKQEMGPRHYQLGLELAVRGTRIVPEKGKTKIVKDQNE